MKSNFQQREKKSQIEDSHSVEFAKSMNFLPFSESETDNFDHREVQKQIISFRNKNIEFHE